MKKIIFISLALFALFAISCTSDKRVNPVLTSGSVWRSASFTDTSMSSAFEYYEIRFVSASTLELWVKCTASVTPEKVNQTYGYAIKDKVISIVYDDATTVGSIEKASMSINENGVSVRFLKL